MSAMRMMAVVRAARRSRVAVMWMVMFMGSPHDHLA
jgi:hypothetical protein